MKAFWLGLAAAFALLTFGCGGGGTTPVSAPTITSFTPTTALAGDQVTISGSHLTGTTAVNFNGASATFTVVSDSKVTATVPSAATSGTISLTTPGGTATSSDSFTVAPAGSRAFWVTQTTSADNYFKQSYFTLAYQDAHCNVWVRLEDAADVSTELAAEYGAYFTQHSYPDVTTYVHQPSEFFDDPERINLLLYNMYVDTSSGGYIAGFFYSVDFYLQADLDAAGYGAYKSNEANCLYINIYGAVSSSDQAQATLQTEGTLTHEFQHLCNAQYFRFDTEGSLKSRDMDSWANELCSVTMESAFASQLDNYYLPLYLSPTYNSGFKTGSCDFLQWRNDWQQYVTNSLFGTYLLSQVPEANRQNLYKAFLQNTQTEGTSSTKTLTSVEDLMAALQDSSLGWTPTGWTTVSDFTTETTHVRDNWAALMTGFGTGLTGTDASYNSYLATLTSLSMQPACVDASGGSFPLNPSGLLIGATYVPDLTSSVITDATSTSSGNQSAYAVVFNGTLPTETVLNDDTISMETATTNIGSSQLVTPSLAAFKLTLGGPSKTWFNRFLEPKLPKVPRILPNSKDLASFSMKTAATDRATIPGAGNTANGGSTTAGYNYCFYVSR